MSNCHVTVPDFVVRDCVFETGRVVGVAFIHKDIFNVINNDPTTPGNWVDQDYSGDLHVFGEVRGDYSGGQPTEVPGFGKLASRVINAEHTLNLSIQDVKGNEDFWNQIGKSQDYYVSFVVGADYEVLMTPQVNVSIYANVPVEEGIDSEVVWKVTIKWRDFDNPVTSDVPTGIFV